MGFLKFLNKKKDGKGKEEEPEIPLPPPKFDSEELELPEFSEKGKETEELKLPEIPELEDAAESQPLPKEKPEPLPFPPMPETPKAEERPEPYKYTPAMPMPEPQHETKMSPMLFNKHEPEHAPRQIVGGEIFIKGEDYREMMEKLQQAIEKQREKAAKPESDAFKAEEKEHNRFISATEDMQRNLVMAEKMLFDEQ